jgi:UDP-perosamine 4-acetyltransferase
MTDLIVIGAGGHGRVAVEVLRRAGLQPVAVVDADVRLHGTALDGVPVIGGDDVILARPVTDVLLVNGIGNAPGSAGAGLHVRQAVYERFRDQGYRFSQVVSRDAVVSVVAQLGDGCHIFTGAIVHPGARIGANAIINTGARIDHDCTIGPHAHVAPGAVLCGGVSVGAQCHIGAGAVIIQNVAIGDGAVIGAGAVVVAPVAPGARILGVPGRVSTGNPPS